ncbi:MAG: ABC transporter permease [Kiritimatiellia bacterium]
MSRARLGPWLLAAAVAAFLGVFLLWPLGHVFVRAFRDPQGFTTLYMRGLFSSPTQLEAIITSLWIATLVSLTCLVIALPLAWLFARRDFPGKPLAAGLLLIPMILPPFVSAVGIKMIFARVGALSTLLLNCNIVDGPVDWLGRWPLLGIVLLEALHLFPVLYLNLVAALANIDPSLEEAAANQGAAPLRVFRRITLPLAAPGLFAGLVLTFIWSFTELGTPLVFGLRRVLPVMIYDRISEIGSNPSGYAQVTFVLVLSALGFWIGKRLTRQGRDVATLGRGSVGRREPRLSRGGALLAWLFLGGVLALAVLPHLSVVLLAVTRRWFLTVLPDGWTLEFFHRALTSELTRTALLNSLGLSIAATLMDLAAGFAIAWVCVRSRLRIGDGLDALAMLPLAVPGLVLAFGYLGAFGSAFRGSALFDPRVNPLLLLAISYAVRRLPFMVRAAHAGLEQVSPVYEEAAANLGATPFRVVRRITLPLVSANLLAGGILCFAFSMLEVSDSLILAQAEPFYPITKAIYAVMDSLENGLNVAAALGVWAMALLAAALLWTAALLGKRMGQMFRAG